MGRQAGVPVREIPVDINQLLPFLEISLSHREYFFPSPRPTNGWKFANFIIPPTAFLLTSIPMETLNRYDRMIARYVGR